MSRESRLPTMKKTFLILASGFSLLASGFASPVEFPLQQMFGTTNYTKPFKLQAAQTFVTDGTNAWIGSDTTVTPSGGTNPIVEVTPNDYLVKFSDAVYPWKIRVSNTTNRLNALNLTIGPLPTFLMDLNPHRTATNVDNATGTNVSLTALRIRFGTFAQSTIEGYEDFLAYKASMAFYPLNAYLSDTNYPEAALPNMAFVISPTLDGDPYLGGTNSTGRNPKFLKVAFNYKPDVDTATSLPNVGSRTLMNLKYDLVNGNDYVSVYNDLEVLRDFRLFGIAYGNGLGLTNLQSTNIAAGNLPATVTNTAPFSAANLRVGTVSGWTGIITNWATGMGVNSNRVYFSSGIVTNVTRP